MTLTHPNKSHPRPEATEAMEAVRAILSRSRIPLFRKQIADVLPFTEGQVGYALEKMHAAGEVEGVGRKWRMVKKVGAA